MTSKPPLDCSSSHDRALALIGSPGTTPDEDRAAALTLADRARDADDLAVLLEMCGLLPYDHPRGRYRWGGTQFRREGVMWP